MVTFIDEWRRKFPSCMVVKRLSRSRALDTFIHHTLLIQYARTWLLLINVYRRIVNENEDIWYFKSLQCARDADRLQDNWFTPYTHSYWFVVGPLVSPVNNVCQKLSEICPALIQSWANVCDVGPRLYQRCMGSSFFAGVDNILAGLPVVTWILYSLSFLWIEGNSGIVYHPFRGCHVMVE